MTKRGTNKKPETSNDDLIIRIITSIVITIILLTAAFRLGSIGIILNNVMRYLLGELYLVVVLTIFYFCAYFSFLKKKWPMPKKVIAGVILLNITLILIFALFSVGEEVGPEAFDTYFAMNPQLLTENDLYYGGGIIGILLYAALSALFARAGTIIVAVALVIICAILIIPITTYLKLFDKMRTGKESLALRYQERKAEREKEKEESYLDVIDEEEEEVYERPESKAFINLDSYEESNSKAFIDLASTDSPKKTEDKKEPTKTKTNTGPYKRPSIAVFDETTSSKVSNINKSSAEIKGKKVIEILHNFGIEATLIATHIGPSVTKFELRPDSSVKVSKIQNIADNIKMELAARDIRIEAPIPGRSAVGIEIPNVEPIPVRMRELIKANPEDNGKLLFYLGKDLMGKVVTCQIDKMPHLLIAGATGSGKSVCINAIICSLLYRTDPSEVRLVLVDPKKVEFTPYHDVPHLLWPVITDATMASNMLKKVVVMMEERFDVFAQFGARNIETYNSFVDDFNKTNDDPEKVMHRLPLIVVIIDELADLMMVAGKDVEASIQRITQLARASGIHLIVATQRPSTDVITGIIKSNIPSRISFSVASSIDSRTILDQTGAERLLGNGDMLYFPQSEPSPIRLQGVYVTDQEVKKITTHVKGQAKPEYDDTYFEFLNLAKEDDRPEAKREYDSLYEDVKTYVIDVQKASTSLLQRRFGIGYNRAAGLIDALEANGIIGPSNGSKPREVFVKPEEDET